MVTEACSSECDRIYPDISDVLEDSAPDISIELGNENYNKARMLYN